MDNWQDFTTIVSEAIKLIALYEKIRTELPEINIDVKCCWIVSIESILVVAIFNIQ